MSGHEAEAHVAALLVSLGWRDDGALDETPRRFAQLLQAFTPRALSPLTTFPAEGSGAVVVRDLPFYSLCAHHLLPFFGHADVAFTPADLIGGFSGIARLVQEASTRPQLQERLAQQVCDAMVTSLAPTGVVVRLRARQLCMEMRGARSSGLTECWAEAGEVAALRSLLV